MTNELDSVTVFPSGVDLQVGHMIKGVGILKNG